MAAARWGPSCSAGADYGVYEGALGDFGSHTSLTCSTAGATTRTVTPSTGDRYYLVVPQSIDREGSYGGASGDAERVQGGGACAPQALAPACVPG